MKPSRLLPNWLNKCIFSPISVRKWGIIRFWNKSILLIDILYLTFKITCGILAIMIN